MNNVSHVPLYDPYSDLSGGYDDWAVRLDHGCFVAGFADAAANFHLAVRARHDHRCGFPWKFTLSFNIRHRETEILEFVRLTLQCGKIRPHGGTWLYMVDSSERIFRRLVPFFRAFPFQSQVKQRDFELFAEMAKQMCFRTPSDRAGIKQLLALRSQMNDGGKGKRKYSDEQILARLPSPSGSVRPFVPSGLSTLK